MEENTQTSEFVTPEETNTLENVKLEVTAKGLYKWSIRVKDDVLSETTLQRLKDLDDKLKLHFPNNVYSVAFGNETNII